MGRHRHLSGRFRRSRGWRRRLVVLFLLVLGVLVSATFYLTRPRRLARLTATLLTDMTGAATSIESARLGSDGTIRLRGVHLRVPEAEAGAEELFAADEAVIKHDVWALFGGRFRPQSLVLIEPTLYLTEDAATGRFNYDALRRARARDRKRRARPKEIPEIIIRGGTVQLGELEDEAYRPLGRFRVSGNLSVNEEKEHAYYFTLRQEAADGGAGPTLSGSFDLETLAVSANMQHFALDSPQKVILPRRWREWWDRLEPAGAVPTVSFAYDPDPSVGFHAILEVRDGELTLPYGDAPPRLRNVSGRFSVTQRSIDIAALRGSIEGLRYRIDGHVAGLDKDAPFDLSVRVEPFEVTQEPPAWLAHLSQIQKLTQRFSPSGKIKALVRLQRAAPGGRIAYSGDAQVWDGRGQYSKFPYPLQNVRGDIRFNDELIELVSILGEGPTGAQVEIRGQISPPADGAAVHVEIAATAVPVDEPLTSALSEKQRDVLGAFLDADAHAQLVEAGLIQTAAQLREGRARLAELTAQREAGAAIVATDPRELHRLDEQIVELKRQLARPVFDLGGTVSAKVVLHRPYGQGMKTATDVTIDVAGAGALFEHWPYPVEFTAGTLRIRGKAVTLRDLAVRGLTGARGTVTGTVAAGEEGARPDVRLQATGVPIDPLLLASLPPKAREWLARTGLRGSLDFTGRVFRGAGDPIAFRIDTTLENGRAQPNGGRVTIEGLSGRATVERESLVIQALAGAIGEARVSLAGSAAWDGPEPRVDMRVAAAALPLGGELLDLVPPEAGDIAAARELFERHRLAGAVDATLTYQSLAQDKPAYHLDLRPAWLNLRYQDRDVELREMSGGVLLSAGHVTLDHLSARAGEAAFTASGDVQLGEAWELDLLLDAQSPRLDERTRAVLPRAVLRVIDALEVSGAYHLRDAHLIYKHAQDAAEREFDFRGQVALNGASASVGVPIAGAAGVVDVQASRGPGDAWPVLDLRMSLDELEAAERRLTAATLRLVTGEKPGVVELRDLRTSIYGGTLLGAGEIDLTQGSRYRMALTLQNAELQPIISPRAPATRPGGAGNGAAAGGGKDIGGTISASLTIEGLPDAPRSRRGRGQLDVRNATIYEVPVAMALLQVFNLSLPTSRAFDRATAHYLLDGDIVRFDSIRLEAPSLEIAGAGSMVYSTRQLDLDLYSRNPAALKLGPVSDLLRGVKDELINIHVGGTLTEPQTEVRTLGGIKRTWDELFGGGEPRRSAHAGEARTSGQ